LTGFSEKIRRYLETQELCRLATASKDGVPHVAALCYATDGERIYISTSVESRKGRNIRENRRVALIVDDFPGWLKERGVLINGEAEFVMSGELHRRARALIYRKYPQWESSYPIEEGRDPILVVTPRKVLPWNI